MWFWTFQLFRLAFRLFNCPSLGGVQYVTFAVTSISPLSHSYIFRKLKCHWSWWCTCTFRDSYFDTWQRFAGTVVKMCTMWLWRVQEGVHCVMFADKLFSSQPRFVRFLKSLTNQDVRPWHCSTKLSKLTMINKTRDLYFDKCVLDRRG